MKIFLKPNKFKITFSIIYIALFYSFGLIHFVADYNQGLFYSFANFVDWILAWPLLFTARLSSWYQIRYEGCTFICLPDTKGTIIAFILGIAYVYVLACCIYYFGQRKVTNARI